MVHKPTGMVHYKLEKAEKLETKPLVTITICTREYSTFSNTFQCIPLVMLVNWTHACNCNPS